MRRGLGGHMSPRHETLWCQGEAGRAPARPWMPPRTAQVLLLDFAQSGVRPHNVWA